MPTDTAVGSASPGDAIAHGGNFTRGMDAALSKMMPSDFSDKRSDYKEFRIKLVLFEKLCARRGNECAIEAALMLATNLTGPSFQAKNSTPMIWSSRTA